MTRLTRADELAIIVIPYAVWGATGRAGSPTTALPPRPAPGAGGASPTRAHLPRAAGGAGRSRELPGGVETRPDPPRRYQALFLAACLTRYQGWDVGRRSSPMFVHGGFFAQTLSPKRAPIPRRTPPRTQPDERQRCGDPPYRQAVPLSLSGRIWRGAAKLLPGGSEEKASLLATPHWSRGWPEGRTAAHTPARAAAPTPRCPPPRKFNAIQTPRSLPAM